MPRPEGAGYVNATARSPSSLNAWLGAYMANPSTTYNSPTYGGNPLTQKPEDYIARLNKAIASAIAAGRIDEVDGERIMTNAADLVGQGEDANTVVEQWEEVLREEQEVLDAFLGKETKPTSTPYGSNPLYSKKNISPAWVSDFTQQHGGQDPITFYGGGKIQNESSALWEADWDRKWGDQFMRTYGRPPSDEDWAHSYQHRNAMKYSGAKPTGG